MKYLSLFSGYGGFELGIQQAYDTCNQQSTEIEQDREGRNGTADEMESDVLSASRSTALCIGFSEIDKYATQVYKKHFPYEECEQCRNNRSLGNRQQLATQTDLQQKETLAISPSGLGDGRGKLSVNNCQCKHKPYGDITKIDPATLPYFDLLCGGFPCQAFSIAGKRAGFEDTRGTLIYDVFRIVKEKHPKLVLLENVKGLLSHDNGRTFKTIITSLAELGYAVEWQVLNAKNFGVPQNRERVFIIGHLGGFSGRQVFPIKGNIKETSECCVHTGTLTSRYPASQREGTYIEENRHRDGEIKQINSPTHSNDRVYGTDGVSPTLNTMQGGRRQPFIPEGAKIRRLTPTECERLMGLPDGWTAEGIEGKISDSQRYKLCGNGVVVNVVKEIIKRLL